MNELQLSAALNFVKGDTIFPSQPPTSHITVAGKDAIQLVQTIGTVDQSLLLGDVGTIGFILLRNFELQVSLLIPAAPSISNEGTPGVATWSYKIVSVDSNGSKSAASPAGTTATGNATLDSTNFNRLTWAADPAAASYDIYRTAHGTSPASNGKIGNVVAPTTTIDDTGLVGDATTPPALSTDKIILFGSDGVNYPLRLKGGEFALIRWNAAAIHAKASAAGPAELHYTIIED